MTNVSIYVQDACIELCDKITKTAGTSHVPSVKFESKKQLEDLWRDVQLNHRSVCVVHPDVPALLEAFRAGFTYMDAAGGLLRNNLGEWLVIWRLGRWDLPKGKAEAGETSEETALREVTEECGLSVTPVLGQHLCDTFHTYLLDEKPVLKKTSWYHMSLPGPTTLKPQVEEGITRLAWRRPDRLDDILRSTYPSVRDVLNTALALEYRIE